MTSYSQIARPYAKAAFDYALEEGALDKWADRLGLLAELSQVSGFKTLITLPEVSSEDIKTFVLEAVGDDLSEGVKNLVCLMAENKRLLALSSLKQCFDHLKDEHEKAIVANVRTYSPLNDAQSDKLIASLKKRLNRDVSLSVQVDKSLLGGAIIEAGDMVIDGSVRGKLKKLDVQLQEA